MLATAPPEGEKPKFEIDPEASLTEHGLTARRRLATDIEPFLGRLADCSGVSEIYERISVEEIKAKEVRSKPELATVTRADAESTIISKVHSIQKPKLMRAKGIGLVPLAENSGSLIIIDFILPDNNWLRSERVEILKVIDSFAPDSLFRWANFSRMGMLIGKLKPGNTKEHRSEVYKLGTKTLQRDLMLGPVMLRPRVKQPEEVTEED